MSLSFEVHLAKTPWPPPPPPQAAVNISLLFPLFDQFVWLVNPTIQSIQIPRLTHSCPLTHLVLKISSLLICWTQKKKRIEMTQSSLVTRNKICTDLVVSKTDCQIQLPTGTVTSRLFSIVVRTPSPSSLSSLEKFGIKFRGTKRIMTAILIAFVLEQLDSGYFSHKGIFENVSN